MYSLNVECLWLSHSQNIGYPNYLKVFGSKKNPKWPKYDNQNHRVSLLMPDEDWL